MPLVYDDLFLICSEEVRLHSFLWDRGLLETLLVHFEISVEKVLFGYDATEASAGTVLFGCVRGQGSAIKSFPFVQIVGLKNLS